MCGIFGWQLPGLTAVDRIALAAGLMIGNAERGNDSFGMWSPEGKITRQLGSIVGGIAAQAIAEHETVLVHTRYATHGSVTLANCHPFVHGNVVGGHNGMIYNASRLDAMYPERDFDVDSMHLIAHIAEKRKMKELEGYGAVMWTETEAPDSAFVAKMVNGELSIARTDGGVVWSSDRDHLVQACALAGLKVAWYTIKTGAVYQVMNGELHRAKRSLKIRPREFAVKQVVHDTTETVSVTEQIRERVQKRSWNDGYYTSRRRYAFDSQGFDRDLTEGFKTLDGAWGDDDESEGM